MDQGVDRRKLLPDKLAKLRDLFKNADAWPVVSEYTHSYLSFLCTLTKQPDPVGIGEYTRPTPLPLEAWKKLHETWLRLPSGFANYRWRLDIYKQTGRQVEEIADERDKFVEVVERASTTPEAVYEGKVLIDGIGRDKRSRLILSWVPEEIMARVTLRYMPGA